MAVWESKGAIVDVQLGGPGNPWLIFGLQGQTVQHQMTGPTGGGTARASRFGRDVNSGLIKRVGRVTDGTPEDITFTLRKRLNTIDWTEIIRKFDCEHSVRVRMGCGNFQDMTEFNVAMLYDWVHATARGLDGNIAEGITDQSPDIMRTIEESAADELMLRNVSHLDISGTLTALALNRVRSFGNFRCAGACGPADDGLSSYIAVSDPDVSLPHWWITLDGGLTWAYTGTINGAGVNPATDVLILGPYVLVTINAATGGVAYALYDDLIAGTATPWTLASGVNIASGAPKAIAASDAQTVWIAGNGGYIQRSTDGGLTFSVVSAGTVTTAQLNSAVFADSSLGYFGGATAALVKYENGVLTLLTLPGGVTGTINVVAVPNPIRRGSEVYIGTSTGQVWRSRQKGATGTWEQIPFPGSGSGGVQDLQFDPTSQVMYVIHTNGSSQSRVLRDLSGGAGGVSVQIVGTYTAPANAIINSIAVAGINDAITVGEPETAQGFIGRIT